MGSYQEKKAMNEVFAHASLNSNQHVVRYFNSWVEEGHVYIQNEFCNGGSFSQMIEERSFPSPDHDVSTDSGAESDEPSSLMKKMGLKEEMLGEEVQTFKIGDLGHVTSLEDGSLSPEEGDCRYMAPELFLMDVDRSLLQQADIFSLGLSLYEAASLKHLPKNSFDGSLYEEIRKGQLPYLTNYSKRFNNLLLSMVKSSPSERPSASKLLKQVSIINKKSQDQLCKELRANQKRLEELQSILNISH